MRSPKPEDAAPLGPAQLRQQTARLLQQEERLNLPSRQSTPRQGRCAPPLSSAVSLVHGSSFRSRCAAPSFPDGSPPNLHRWPLAPAAPPTRQNSAPPHTART